ncbi:MAG: hypothetical protein WBF90_23420 [Rivularia sp. (in: cyanobacteria)]
MEHYISCCRCVNPENTGHYKDSHKKTTRVQVVKANLPDFQPLSYLSPGLPFTRVILGVARLRIG